MPGATSLDQAIRGAVAGPGTTKAEIRKYLGDSTNPLRVKFEALAEGSQGGPNNSPDAPRNNLGRFVIVHPDDETPINPNVIMVDGEAISVEVNRDRSREPHAGTSVGYAVRRLEKESARDPAVAAG